MTTLLVGTDSVETSEAIADHLAETVTGDDEVVVVNSQPGGEETTPDELEAGEAAIDTVADRLRDRVTSVETHQFVQGNEPVEDLLECAADVGADQFVIGFRSHSPVGKIVFGSTAQSVLLTADRPVLGVPLAEKEEIEETPTIFQSH